MSWAKTFGVLVGVCILGVCAVAWAQAGVTPTSPTGPLGSAAGAGGGVVVGIGGLRLLEMVLKRKKGEADSDLLGESQKTNALLGELIDHHKDMRRDTKSQHEDNRRDHQSLNAAMGRVETRLEREPSRGT